MLLYIFTKNFFIEFDHSNFKFTIYNDNHSNMITYSNKTLLECVCQSTHKASLFYFILFCLNLSNTFSYPFLDHFHLFYIQLPWQKPMIGVLLYITLTYFATTNISAVTSNLITFYHSFYMFLSWRQLSFSFSVAEKINKARSHIGAPSHIFMGLQMLESQCWPQHSFHLTTWTLG